MSGSQVRLYTEIWAVSFLIFWMSELSKCLFNKFAENYFPFA